MPEPDCFLSYRISHATRNFSSGKSDIYVLVAAATRGITTVSFTEAVSRRNTFVGGTCAPPSARLVIITSAGAGYGIRSFCLSFFVMSVILSAGVCK